MVEEEVEEEEDNTAIVIPHVANRIATRTAMSGVVPLKLATIIVLAHLPIEAIGTVIAVLPRMVTVTAMAVLPMVTAMDPPTIAANRAATMEYPS